MLVATMPIAVFALMDVSSLLPVKEKDLTGLHPLMVSFILSNASKAKEQYEAMELSLKKMNSIPVKKLSDDAARVLSKMTKVRDDARREYVYYDVQKWYIEKIYNKK